MENQGDAITHLQAAENALKAQQSNVGRGSGGQEIAYALTRIREARLFLADAPTVTPFTDKGPVLGDCFPPKK